MKEQLRAVPGDGAGYGLLAHLNPRTAPLLAGLSQPAFALNFLGRAVVPKVADWAPAPELDALTGIDTGPGMLLPHPVEINVAVADGPEGRSLEVTWAYHFDVVPGTAVRQLADAWFDALRELSAQRGGGGYTPSDLDLVELTQEEIDEFEAGLEAL